MADEVLASFIQNEAYPHINNILLELDHRFQEEKGELKENFLHLFKETCNKILMYQNKENHETAYLSYTLLRSNLLYGSNIYDVHIYDSDWYLKDYIKIDELDASCFFAPISNLKDELYRLSKRYAGKIHVGNVDNYISLSLECFNHYVVQFLRYSILNALECEEFQHIKKADIFSIHVSELYGQPCVIHKEVKNKNHEEEIFRQNINDQISSQNFDLKKIDLSNYAMRNNKFCYSDFSGSNMCSSDLTNSILEGAKFRGAIMRDSKLPFTYVSGADFANANMQGADFSYSRSHAGYYVREHWQYPSDLPTNFDKTNLKGAIFDNAIFTGIDFSRALLEEVSFWNTYLKNSKFTKKQIDKVNLSEKQLEQIILVD